VIANVREASRKNVDMIEVTRGKGGEYVVEKELIALAFFFSLNHENVNLATITS